MFKRLKINKKETGDGPLKMLTDDHISIAVTIECRAKGEPVLNLLHPIDQVGGVSQVGVRMATTEVLQDVGFDEALLRSSELVSEYSFGVRSRN